MDLMQLRICHNYRKFRMVGRQTNSLKENDKRIFFTVILNLRSLDEKKMVFRKTVGIFQ